VQFLSSDGDHVVHLQHQCWQGHFVDSVRKPFQVVGGVSPFPKSSVEEVDVIIEKDLLVVF